MKVSFKKMEDYCVAQFGASLLQVEAVVALWVAEHFGGRSNWKTIRNKREKIGKFMMEPAFQSPCWA